MFEHKPSETCCTALGFSFSVLSSFSLAKVLDYLCCGLLCAFVKCKVLGSHQAEECSTSAVMLLPGVAVLRVSLFCSQTCGAGRSCRIWGCSMQMLTSPRMKVLLGSSCGQCPEGTPEGVKAWCECIGKAP